MQTLRSLTVTLLPSAPMASRVSGRLSVVVSLLLISSSISAGSSAEIAFRADLWPGIEISKSQPRKVHFYTSRQAALRDPCLRTHQSELSGFFDDAHGRLQLGEMCGELFALTHPANHMVYSQRANKFVGVHETFHLVAQIFSGRAPSAVAFDVRPKATPGSDRFFNELASALERGRGTENGTTFAGVAQRYESLSDEDRVVVDFFSTVEWPAEYYAYKVLASEDRTWSPESYIELRHEIGFEPAYLAAVSAGIELDRVLGPGKWEERVISGESMLGLLSKLPAASPTRRVWQVNITSWPLTF